LSEVYSAPTPAESTLSQRIEKKLHLFTGLKKASRFPMASASFCRGFCFNCAETGLRELRIDRQPEGKDKDCLNFAQGEIEDLNFSATDLEHLSSTEPPKKN
jgi:hypothetical protein